MESATRMRGILQAPDEDRRRGSPRPIEYAFYADTFDDFLDHAARFQTAGKVHAAAILAGAVLEDTIKRIATKNDVDGTRELELVIDDLVKASALSSGDGKRVKSYATVRNSAFDGRWDEVDLQSVKDTIDGLRGLIESALR